MSRSKINNFFTVVVLQLQILCRTTKKLAFKNQLLKSSDYKLLFKRNHYFETFRFFKRIIQFILETEDLN